MALLPHQAEWARNLSTRPGYSSHLFRKRARSCSAFSGNTHLHACVLLPPSQVWLSYCCARKWTVLKVLPRNQTPEIMKDVRDSHWGQPCQAVLLLWWCPLQGEPFSWPRDAPTLALGRGSHFTENLMIIITFKRLTWPLFKVVYLVQSYSYFPQTARGLWSGEGGEGAREKP